MREMKGPILGRFLVGILLCIALVVVASVVFGLVNSRPVRVWPPRYVYSVFGPALALHTPMSVFLFAQQSLLLMPWLLLGAAYPRFMKVSLTGAILTWLGIGWYMHKLW
jgi:hypothetical protein